LSALAFIVASTFAYYVLARAEITRPLWSRYRGSLDALARCAACSGFWIGLALSAALEPPWWMRQYGLASRVVWGGVWGLVGTPIGVALLVVAVRVSTVRDDGDGDASE
jgi:hypothetical protein